MNRKIIIITPVIALIISLIIFFIVLKNGWFGEPGLRGQNFCEHSRDALIKQPANTFSNIGFMIVGFFIAWLLMKEKFNVNRNRLTITLFYPTFFATICVLLGPGSMAMHASTTIIGSYFDVLSMYLVAAFMFSYAFIRLFNLSEPKFFLSYLFVIIICNSVYFFNRPLFGWLDRNAIFGVFVVLATLLEYAIIYRNKISIEKKWAFFYSFTFIIAYIIWQSSKTGRMLCHEYSLIQGHAIWHILAAVTFYFMFRYYVSETDIKLQKNSEYGK